MNDKAMLNQKKISELKSICDELDNIGILSSKTDGDWNDEVYVEFQKKIGNINAKKRELIREIETLEEMIKNN